MCQTVVSPSLLSKLVQDILHKQEVLEEARTALRTQAQKLCKFRGSKEFDERFSKVGQGS